MKWATLCYVRQNGQTLMLHRIKRQADMHAGKWNGLGGKLFPGETPEECVIREVKEESGLLLDRPELRGLLTFPKFSKDEDWYAFVFVATRFSGELIECIEGELHWIDDDHLLELNLWEGDRLFIPWLDQPGFFSGRFEYAAGRLVQHDVIFYPVEEDGESSAQEQDIQKQTGAPLHTARVESVEAAQFGDNHWADDDLADDEVCWLCGSAVVKRHCKITCTVCGFRRDCSDP